MSITNENIKELVQAYLDGGSFPEGLDDLDETPIDEWDVSQVTNMSGLFNDRDFDEDINNWDVSNVTDMSSMFANADEFNQPIGDWNVSNVANMEHMFQGADKFNQPIGDWIVSYDANVDGMFNSATAFNQDLTNWRLAAAANIDDNEMFVNSGMAGVELHYPNAQPLSPEELQARQARYALAHPAGVRSAPVIPAVFDIENGHLNKNTEYLPECLDKITFVNGNSKLTDKSMYVDLVSLVNESVLATLRGDREMFAFKVNNDFVVISKSDILKVMNNPNAIKYGCNKVVNGVDFTQIQENTNKKVPYLSINSIGASVVGLVPFFDLWNAINSDDRAFELNRMKYPELKSTASHNVLFGPGALSERVISSAHCQSGVVESVWRLRLLPTADGAGAGGGNGRGRKFKSQKQSTKSKDGKKRSNRRKHVIKHNKKTRRIRKGARTHKKIR